MCIGISKTVKYLENVIKILKWNEIFHAVVHLSILINHRNWYIIL